MIAIVASRHDDTARALAQRWQEKDAAVLTPDDLSEPGWRYRPGHASEGAAVIGGREVGIPEIKGVLTRLWSVNPSELDRIAPAERSYVAAEMTAFLVAWLGELPCPVFSRPTAAALMGSGWRPEQWRLAATRAGLPVRELRPAVGTSEALSALMVVGDQTVGAAHPYLRPATLRLAADAGVECITAIFSGPNADAAFLSASPTVDVLDPAVADALLSRLSQGEP